MDIQYLKDNYEIRDGHLYYKKPGPHRTVGCRAGSVNDDGYVKVKVQGKTHSEHRLIYLMTHGELPEYVDHKDTNPSNNNKENLRPATMAQNSRNSKIRSDNTSGVKGVNWAASVGKWQVRIQVDDLRINLGTFETIAEAKIAISNQREKLHGEFHRHK